MTRLLVHVEGRTEFGFVREVLRPHLLALGFTSVDARLIGTRLQSRFRGGITSWSSMQKAIVADIGNDRNLHVTTMTDYYGLPHGRWPKRREAARLGFSDNVRLVENAMSDDVHEKMGGDFDRRRFVPHVTMHEFEAILFSDCEGFAHSIDRPELAPRFREIRDRFPGPEQIDDSPQQAPSKRIEALVGAYDKPVQGVLAVLEIGLPRIRDECPHFSRWLGRLEDIPGHVRTG